MFRQIRMPMDPKSTTESRSLAPAALGQFLAKLLILPAAEGALGQPGYRSALSQPLEQDPAGAGGVAALGAWGRYGRGVHAGAIA